MNLITVHITEDLKTKIINLAEEEWGDPVLRRNLSRLPADNYLVDPEEVQEEVAEDPTSSSPLVNMVACIDYFGLLEQNSTPYPAE